MPACVYVLCDPGTGEIRYVGKTERSLEQRLRGHLKDARRADKRHVCCWIRTLDVPPKIELVEETSAELLNEAEVFYISYFRSLGFRLTNLTEGGDGSPGGHWKLKPRSPEHCAKIGAAHKGKPLSAEHRAKLSRATKGIPKGPFTKEHCEAIGRARKGKPGPKFTDEQRLEQSRKRGGHPFVDQFGNRYEIVRQTARELGLQACNITNVLRGREKSIYGYVFRYVEE